MWDERSGVADTWKDWLWDGATGIYDAILAHPFLAGLTDGSLDPESVVREVQR